MLRPETAAAGPHAYADKVARDDERLRNILGRTLIFVSPVAAALCALALRRLQVSNSVTVVSQETIMLVNLAVAICGSAAGVAVLRGRLSVKISGSLAYGVLSFFVYVILFYVFVTTRLWPM